MARSGVPHPAIKPGDVQWSGDRRGRQATLGEAILGEAILGEAMLGEAMLGEAMLGEAMLGEAMLAAIMGAVFRTSTSSVALRAPSGGRSPVKKIGRLMIGCVGLALVVGGCGSSQEATSTTVPSGPAVPQSLDGVWILAGAGLTLDIDTETATVDAKTSCARLLGSLTFEDEGRRTSFSLPGRDDSNCSDNQITSLERTVNVINSVARASARPGGYVLRDANGAEVAQLDFGG